jgi:hypothetical protein
VHPLGATGIEVPVANQDLTNREPTWVAVSSEIVTSEATTGIEVEER